MLSTVSCMHLDENDCNKLKSTQQAPSAATIATAVHLHSRSHVVFDGSECCQLDSAQQRKKQKKGLYWYASQWEHQ